MVPVNSHFHVCWFACWYFVAVENNIEQKYFLLNFIIEEWGYEMSASATALISYDAYSLSDVPWVHFRSNQGNTFMNCLAYRSLSLSDKIKGSCNCDIE